MFGKLKAVALTISIIGAGVLAIALTSGLLYEQSQRSRDREHFPRIGRSVDIGGRTLNIDCSGAGQPAVILERGAPWTFSKPREAFENGTPRPGYGWVRIQHELAKDTMTCWYDRAGSGWSDPGPYPRDSASQARDLHALLAGAGIAPPYVMVAESSAALDAHVYAGFYPGDVAGLVLVNGVHPDLLIKTRPGGARLARIPAFVGHSQDAVAQIFNQVGLYRLGPARPSPAPPKGMTALEWDTIWHLTQSSKARSSLIQEIASWAPSTAEARAAGSLGDRPLIVLSAENTAVASENPSVWMELQADLTGLSSRGKRVVLDESHGELIYQAPDAVVEAARQVIADVRHPPDH